jgi:hypothetical protein
MREIHDFKSDFLFSNIWRLTIWTFAIRLLDLFPHLASLKVVISQAHQTIMEIDHLLLCFIRNYKWIQFSMGPKGYFKRKA